MKKLSIIILNYNTEKLTTACLESLKKVQGEVPMEVIVVDNASDDISVETIKRKYKWVTLVESDKNRGFAAGNNLAKEYVSGEYVLFLNSDTLVNKSVLSETVKYLDEHKEVGAITCKLILPNGSLDKDARRSFPTPWVALSHFLLLDRLFPHSRIFARYWYGYISSEEEHEIDVLQGAFFMTRKKILNEVDWFDETYFLNGEDIDLSWKIKEKGWKMIYFPKVSIVHVKKASKRLGNRLKNEVSGVKSMEIFYRRRMWKKYPLVVNLLVLSGIQGIKLLRGILNFAR